MNDSAQWYHRTSPSGRVEFGKTSGEALGVTELPDGTRQVIAPDSYIKRRLSEGRSITSCFVDWVTAGQPAW